MPPGSPPPPSALLEAFGRLAARDRTPAANRQLGGLLAFIAGAVNAGGFLAVARYTSHVTGMVSSAADELVLGQPRLALAAAAMVAAFLAGAAAAAMLVNWARRHRLQAEYALPLLLEAGLLCAFALVGAPAAVAGAALLPFAVTLLCFVMGLQNAVITKVSGSEIRTTHMTGIVTDLGIELGRLAYRNRDAQRDQVHFVRADRRRMALQGTVLLLFIAGAVLGALAFRQAGFAVALVPAVVLLAVAAPPVAADAAQWLRQRRHRVDSLP